MHSIFWMAVIGCVWAVSGVIAVFIHDRLHEKEGGLRNMPAFEVGIGILFGPFLLFIIWPLKLLGYVVYRLLRPLASSFVLLPAAPFKEWMQDHGEGA